MPSRPLKLPPATIPGNAGNHSKSTATGSKNARLELREPRQAQRGATAIADPSRTPGAGRRPAHVSSGDRALVWARWSGHGTGSGVPIEMEMAQVITFGDGKIRRIEEYMDRAKALDAVALAADRRG